MKKVPTDEVGKQLAYISPLIQKAIDKTNEIYTTTDILERLIKGEMDLWLNPNGIVITQCTPPILNIGICVGENIDDWIEEIVDRLKFEARASGCAYLQEIGRRGWVKRMEKLGFKEQATIMRCKV